MYVVSCTVRMSYLVRTCQNHVIQVNWQKHCMSINEDYCADKETFKLINSNVYVMLYSVQLNNVHR